MPIFSIVPRDYVSETWVSHIFQADPHPPTHVQFTVNRNDPQLRDHIQIRSKPSTPIWLVGHFQKVYSLATNLENLEKQILVSFNSNKDTRFVVSEADKIVSPGYYISQEHWLVDLSQQFETEEM